MISGKEARAVLFWAGGGSLRAQNCTVLALHIGQSRLESAGLGTR